MIRENKQTERHLSKHIVIILVTCIPAVSFLLFCASSTFVQQLLIFFFYPKYL